MSLPFGYLYITRKTVMLLVDSLFLKLLLSDEHCTRFIQKESKQKSTSSIIFEPVAVKKKGAFSYHNSSGAMYWSSLPALFESPVFTNQELAWRRRLGGEEGG
jgi:hypothetical protein